MKSQSVKYLVLSSFLGLLPLSALAQVAPAAAPAVAPAAAPVADIVPVTAETPQAVDQALSPRQEKLQQAHDAKVGKLDREMSKKIAEGIAGAELEKEKAKMVEKKAALDAKLVRDLAKAERENRGKSDDNEARDSARQHDSTRELARAEKAERAEKVERAESHGGDDVKRESGSGKDSGHDDKH